VLENSGQKYLKKKMPLFLLFLANRLMRVMAVTTETFNALFYRRFGEVNML